MSSSALAQQKSDFACIVPSAASLTQMRPCHSGRVFVQAVARVTQQAFLECMVAAFDYFDTVFPMVTGWITWR